VPIETVNHAVQLRLDYGIVVDYNIYESQRKSKSITYLKASII
jgi:hypothetical protein